MDLSIVSETMLNNIGIFSLPLNFEKACAHVKWWIGDALRRGVGVFSETVIFSQSMLDSVFGNGRKYAPSFFPLFRASSQHLGVDQGSRTGKDGLTGCGRLCSRVRTRSILIKLSWAVVPHTFLAFTDCPCGYLWIESEKPDPRSLNVLFPCLFKVSCKRNALDGHQHRFDCFQTQAAGERNFMAGRWEMFGDQNYGV